MTGKDSTYQTKDQCGDNHEACSCHGLDGHDTCISQVPIFNHLEENQMKEILGTIKTFSFKKGELIYLAGDTSDALYIVSKGKVRIYRLSDSGKEQLVRFLNPGDYTGELALFRESIHESYAEAVSESSVCMIKRADLNEFLLKYPTISLKLLTEFSNRLETSEKQTTRFATEKVETRLALFLAECSDNEGNSVEIKLPMSKKDLASYLGTTPETISRKLADLEHEGYIKQGNRRKITIINLDGLLLL